MKALDTIQNPDENSSILILSLTVFSEYNEAGLLSRMFLKSDYTETEPIISASFCTHCLRK